MARGIFADDSGDGRSSGRAGDFGTWLRELPELVRAVEADTGEALAIVLPRVPRPDQARLLEALGVVWTVAAVTVTTDQVTVRCSLGCEWSYAGEREEAVESALWHREQIHAVPVPSAGRLPLSGGYGFSIEEGGTVDGLDALERMDRGERQRPVGEGEPNGGEPPAGSAAVGPSGSGSSPSPNGRKAYTRDSIVQAIKDYAAEHGHAPTTNRPPGAALSNAARRLGIPWSELVSEADTVKPPTGAAAHRKPLGAAEPAKRPGGASRKKQPRQKPSTAAVAKPRQAKVATTDLALRDPIRTADIPYDADRLEDEAGFLRRRAAAMDELAQALRKFEEISRD